jgi:phospholipase/lecithinase/hemolysin
VVEGTTAAGVVIVSNVSNSGILEALGTNANLTLDGTVTQTANGVVRTSGSAAHVGLSSATISGGQVQIGSAGIVESIAGTGLSTIANAAVTGPGTLQANDHSELSVTNSTLATSVALMSNGNGSVLSVDGAVGALAGTIGGGEIEFKGTSASNITFTQDQVGTLKLDSSFTGTVSGLVGAVPQSFTNFFAFGDSSIDSGALQYLSPFLPMPPNPGLTNRLQNALANGGTDSPVGVGSMNSQLLAADFGLSANTAYTTGGVIVGGGTNYAIAGALDAAVSGNGGISNINQAGTIPNPALLSTVAQVEAYLSSAGGSADPSALFLISSGANDVSYALNDLPGNEQSPYVLAQADTLAVEIEKLSAAGAEHILVNPIMNSNNNSLSISYSTELFQKLDASGIPYIKSDVYAMTQDVIANPMAYGFTSTTVHPGVEGPGTESALVQVQVPNKTFNGWGLWGADATSPEGNNVPGNFQYSYLSTPDAEQTHFFADDQHLSAAGQQIQANLDDNLVADDKIDLTSLPYVFGNTVASFSDVTPAGGTLSVTNGTDSANIALLGNYLASTFVTASDGTGGTLVMDQSSATPPQLLAVTHS